MFCGTPEFLGTLVGKHWTIGCITDVFILWGPPRGTVGPLLGRELVVCMRGIFVLNEI
jgi:hypothetical protein